MILVNDINDETSQQLANNNFQLVFEKPKYLVENTEMWDQWLSVCKEIEILYFALLEWGITSSQVNSLLPIQVLPPQVIFEK